MLNRRMAVLALAASLGAASGAHGQGKKVRVAFANFNDEASLGVVVLRGLQAAAKARPDLEVVFYDNKQDATRVVENARLIAATRADVFIEYNTIAVAANNQVARLTAEAKIPVLAVQARVPGAALFSIDNAMGGYASGQALAVAAREKWPGATPAVLLIGLPESGQLFIERAEAARKAILEVFPAAVIDEHSSKNDPNTARQVTADVLTKNQGRKLIVWAHVDQMGIAALTATRNAGREQDVLISSTGGEAIVLPEIRRANGPYVGTFSFFPELWGKELLELAAKLARKQPVPELTRPSKQLFVDRSNIDAHFSQ